MSKKNTLKKRRRYTAEFKADAVKLATMPGANITQVARSLGIADGSLRIWIRQSKEQEAGGLTLNENQRLREEKEILEKATVFFAKNRR